MLCSVEIGEIVSETTYDRFFISEDARPIVTFPVFYVGQPEEAPTAYWQAFLFPAETHLPHEDTLSVLSPGISQSRESLSTGIAPNQRPPLILTK